jgi:DNA-binding response OmpR family regulator
MVPKTRQKQVLVIEDEQDLRQFTAWCLEAEGYQVLQAADGDEGIKKARQNKVALILLDIKMPHRYGWSVLAEIKSTPALSDVPVVIFTASADVNLKSSFIKMGAADYLVKPVSAAKLKECVTRLLKKD